MDLTFISSDLFLLTIVIFFVFILLKLSKYRANVSKLEKEQSKLLELINKLEDVHEDFHRSTLASEEQINLLKTEVSKEQTAQANTAKKLNKVSSDFQNTIKLKNKELLSLNKELAKYQSKYSEFFDKEKQINTLSEYFSELQQQVHEIRTLYKEKKIIFDKLQAEAAIYDETIQLAESGIYRPSFNFDHSEEYKNQILQNKEAQKVLLKSAKAITCTTEWSVEGSKSKGREMSIRNGKLASRAFNSECEAALSSIKWNNASRMIERVNKAFLAINKLNEPNHIHIEREYLDLKIEQIRLTHEYHEKKQQEKEEQAAIRQQMREEAKLEKELLESIKEEEKYKKLLEKANNQATKATGEKLNELEQQVSKLTLSLNEAHQKSERAKSMAEQTKAGHVYVISNIGSFGENVYKIGMTRRLEPLDRVKELGDASVPFLFDVHAMIYTDNAPGLEKKLHKEFDDKRINLVNSRKEFFNVKLSEIEKVVNKEFSGAEFHLIGEAREYNESLAIRELNNINKSKASEYPEEI